MLRRIHLASCFANTSKTTCRSITVHSVSWTIHMNDTPEKTWKVRSILYLPTHRITFAGPKGKVVHHMTVCLSLTWSSSSTWQIFHSYLEDRVLFSAHSWNTKIGAVSWWRYNTQNRMTTQMKKICPLLRRRRRRTKKRNLDRFSGSKTVLSGSQEQGETTCPIRGT